MSVNRITGNLRSQTFIVNVSGFHSFRTAGGVHIQTAKVNSNATQCLSINTFRSYVGPRPTL
jgi:hypothetical protein